MCVADFLPDFFEVQGCESSRMCALRSPCQKRSTTIIRSVHTVCGQAYPHHTRPAMDVTRKRARAASTRRPVTWSNSCARFRSDQTADADRRSRTGSPGPAVPGRAPIGSRAADHDAKRNCHDGPLDVSEGTAREARVDLRSCRVAASASTALLRRGVRANGIRRLGKELIATVRRIDFGASVEATYQRFTLPLARRGRASVWRLDRDAPIKPSSSRIVEFQLTHGSGRASRSIHQ